MFKLIRKKGITKGILSILVVSMLISVFILWGSNIGGRGRKNLQYIGEIFNKKITLREFAHSLQSSYILAKLIYKENFYNLKDFINFNLQAWQRLIILEAAKKENIKITNNELIDYIHRFDLFQAKEGFSLELYKLLTQNLGISEREFEEMMRQQLAIERFIDGVTEDITVTDSQLLEEYKKEYESVDLDIIKISPEDFKDKVYISIEETRAYFQDNSFDFKQPDKVNVQYIGIEYEDDTTEEEIIEIKNKMDDIYQELKRLKDISKVVQDNSLKLKETGLFAINEPIPELGWLPEFSKQAFSLKENHFSISNPIDTPRGYYILKLKEFKPTHIPEFEEIKDKVMDVLKTKKANDLAKDKATEYKQDIEKQVNRDPKLSLKDVAEVLKIKSERIEGFKRNNYLPGAGFSKEMEDFAFDLTKEGISDIIQTPSGFFITKRVEFKGISEEKFLEDKENFKEKILRQKKELAFKEYMEKELKPKTSLFVDLSSEDIYQ